MKMKTIRTIAIIYVVAEFFFTPGIGLVQTHAQSASPCAVTNPPPPSTKSLMGPQSSANVTITGGCVDGVMIGTNTPVTYFPQAEMMAQLGATF